MPLVEFVRIDTEGAEFVGEALVYSGELFLLESGARVIFEKAVIFAQEALVCLLGDMCSKTRRLTFEYRLSCSFIGQRDEGAIGFEKP